MVQKIIEGWTDFDAGHRHAKHDALGG